MSKFLTFGLFLHLQLQSIQEFHLHQFRIYYKEHFSFSQGLNLLVGDNGHGKSSLIEAIHFTCLGHSPFTHYDKEMIQWEQGYFVLRAILEGDENSTDALHQQSVQFFKTGKKKIKWGEDRALQESQKLSDLVGKIPIVLFFFRRYCFSTSRSKY